MNENDQPSPQPPPLASRPNIGPIDYQTPTRPQPLDYASGLYGHPGDGGSVFRYILGFLTGLLILVPVGIGAIISQGSAAPQIVYWGRIILFGGICLVALIGLVAAKRAHSWKQRHWFLTGFLTGLCLTALVECLCFANL